MSYGALPNNTVLKPSGHEQFLDTWENILKFISSGSQWKWLPISEILVGESLKTESVKMCIKNWYDTVYFQSTQEDFHHLFNSFIKSEERTSRTEKCEVS